MLTVTISPATPPPTDILLRLISARRSSSVACDRFSESGICSALSAWMMAVRLAFPSSRRALLDHPCQGPKRAADLEIAIDQRPDFDDGAHRFSLPRFLAYQS